MDTQGWQDPAEERHWAPLGNAPHPKWSTAMAGVPRRPCLQNSPATTQQMLNQLTELLEVCEKFSLNLSSAVSTTGDGRVKLVKAEEKGRFTYQIYGGDSPCPACPACPWEQAAARSGCSLTPHGSPWTPSTHHRVSVLGLTATFNAFQNHRVWLLMPCIKLACI